MMNAGMVGGIVGVMGGVIGTYFSIRNSAGPRERALIVRLSVLIWLWMAVFIDWLFLGPRPWNQAVIPLNLLLIPWLPRGNRWLACLRAEDKAEAAPRT